MAGVMVFGLSRAGDAIGGVEIWGEDDSELIGVVKGGCRVPAQQSTEQAPTLLWQIFEPILNCIACICVRLLCRHNSLP
jgi:hypothetical protein